MAKSPFATDAPAYHKFLEKIPEKMDLEVNVSCPNIEHSLVCQNIHKFLNKSIILIFVFTIINSLTDNGSKKHYLYIIILLLFSFIYNGSTIMEPSGAGSINQWVYISISFGIFIIVLYKQFISYNLS